MFYNNSQMFLFFSSFYRHFSFVAICAISLNEINKFWSCTIRLKLYFLSQTAKIIIILLYICLPCLRECNEIKQNNYRRVIAQIFAIDCQSRWQTRDYSGRVQQSHRENRAQLYLINREVFDAWKLFKINFQSSGKFNARHSLLKIL